MSLAQPDGSRIKGWQVGPGTSIMRPGRRVVGNG
jgi:hypothetical protein